MTPGGMRYVRLRFPTICIVSTGTHQRIKEVGMYSPEDIAVNDKAVWLALHLLAPSAAVPVSRPVIV